MKKAREYYSDVFEGIRLFICGAVMLAVSLAVWSVSGVASLFMKGGGDNAGKETLAWRDEGGVGEAEVVDAY